MAAPRRFDHAEAAARHEAGESYEKLAATYGVATTAVYMAVRQLTDPEFKQRRITYYREYQRRTGKTACSRCGAVIWKDRYRVKTKTGLCRRCIADDRVTTVREDTLRCSECGDWKPDRMFPHSKHHERRRNRHPTCRGCQAAARQRSRHARRVPCVNCGQPKLHPDDTRNDTGLCVHCFHASLRNVRG